jgi:enamine deaminase RidA (YjgF/YER057c/UK114 family)
MESLGETLKYLGVDWSRAVHVKAFMQPMSDAMMVREEIAKVFAGAEAPPIVLVEWTSKNPPIEIEVIASTPGAKEPIEFLTPPQFKPSPVYTKVVRIGTQPRIYLSGLRATGEAAAQVHDIFAQLKGALSQTGSDLRHLVKATYYVSADDVSKALNELRPQYYDPQRPPAASKIAVRSVGPDTATLSIDMIAVPAR